MAREWLRFAALAVLALACAAAGVSQASDRRTGTRAEVAGDTRIMVDPLIIGYTREFMADERKRRRVLSGPDVDQIRQDYQDVLTQKLAIAYAIAGQPGPRVVRVEGYLVDHEYDNREGVGATVRFNGAPRFRLVALLRDSRTDEILDRVALKIGPRPSRLMKNSPGYYRYFMRSAFDRIATRVQWAIEDGAEAS